MQSPTTAPAASHQRGSRSRARATQSSTAAHRAKSTVAVMKRCPVMRGRAANANDQADSAWAVRPPPSSRVVRAARTMAIAMQIVAGIRIAQIESPNRAIAVLAMSGVRGGWSTYPQAGSSIRK